MYLYLHPDKPLSHRERGNFRSLIKSRRAGTPLQHLTGEVGFYGLRFSVGRHALIPRPETEELVDKALGLIRTVKQPTCLDLGTGSGVIAICLAKYVPSARVTGVDISEDALRLAQKNAERNGVHQHITWKRSHWMTDLSGRFDLIVSNPPYVAEDDLDRLPDEVRQHEPRVALNGGKSGTECIEQILTNISDHLAPSGHVLLEIAPPQRDRVLELVSSTGLAEGTADQDLAGKERFVVATCQS